MLRAKGCCAATSSKSINILFMLRAGTFRSIFQRVFELSIVIFRCRSTRSYRIKRRPAFVLLRLVGSQWAGPEPALVFFCVVLFLVFLLPPYLRFTLFPPPPPCCCRTPPPSWKQWHISVNISCWRALKSAGWSGIFHALLKKREYLTYIHQSPYNSLKIYCLLVFSQNRDNSFFPVTKLKKNTVTVVCM